MLKWLIGGSKYDHVSSEGELEDINHQKFGMQEAHLDYAGTRN